MKRFAVLLLSLCTATAFAQSDVQSDPKLTTASEAAPATTRFVPDDQIPCQYGLAAGTPRKTTPNGPAAVHVSLDEQGQVKDAELWRSSGDAAFDNLALRQSRLATCKPVLGLFGKSIPVETTFWFVATPAKTVASGSAVQPYARKIQRLVRANLRWHGEDVTLPAVVAVNCSPDGKLLSATIVHSSGNSAWDDAALRAVQDSDPMPADENGKTPAHFTITYYQRR
ncbi:TonB family protein [Paraburkholderia adhaesiva]|uniref:TonB family protein n=1 Tax=Paraburkholderia adhaesiva TaxID=2883244 RepID=UPI0035712F46